MTAALEPQWEPLRHHPTLYSSRQGCWASCSCGWQSSYVNPGGFRNVIGAHLAFGVHLVEVAA